jgi:hypothetical protein
MVRVSHTHSCPAHKGSNTGAREVSAQLDSLLDAQRKADCARHDLSAWDGLAQQRAIREWQGSDDNSSVVQDAADARTRAARAEIAKLALLDEPEALSLLMAMVKAFSDSRILSCSVRGEAAVEKLLDAVHFLENGL